MGEEDEEINRVTGKPFAVRKDETVEQAEARKEQQETNRVSRERFHDEHSGRDERIALQSKSRDERTARNKSWDERIAALIPNPPITKDNRIIQKLGPRAEKYGTKFAKAAYKETFKRRKKLGIQRHIPKPINIRTSEEEMGARLIGVPEGMQLRRTSFLSQSPPVNIFGSHEASREVQGQQRPPEQGTSPSIFGSSKPINFFGTNNNALLKKKKLGWI